MYTKCETHYDSEVLIACDIIDVFYKSCNLLLATCTCRFGVISISTLFLFSDILDHTKILQRDVPDLFF